MLAYRKKIVIQNPKQVVLTDLPFEPGQEVEIFVLQDDSNRARRVEELKTLFEETQALTQLQSITEEEIAGEVAACREGR